MASMRRETTNGTAFVMAHGKVLLICTLAFVLKVIIKFPSHIVSLALVNGTL